MRRTSKNSKNIIICPRDKQFKNIIVCAASCKNKCSKYSEKISFKALEEYIKEHPEYKIEGEIMAKKTSKKNEKKYWVFGKGKSYEEVTESEIVNNPAEFIGKEIWQKPTYKCEVVVKLKRHRAD